MRECIPRYVLYCMRPGTNQYHKMRWSSGYISTLLWDERIAIEKNRENNRKSREVNISFWQFLYRGAIQVYCS